MSKRSVSGLRGACAFVAGASLCVATGFAQQAAGTDSAVKLEKYVVTGSNIPSTEVAGEARTFPVQLIDRKMIDQSGVFSTTELLQRMSLSNGGGVPFTNNATGFTPGATAPSLRGLGPNYTLTLVNGRRLAPYPVGDNGTSAFVDINSIPLAAIDRIEVLKDGASAVYGADAVAGVVNLILRKNYNGSTAQITYGNTTDKDSGDLNGSIIWGAGNDAGHLMIGLNYQHRNAIFQRDRSYSAIPPFLSSNSSPANFQLSRDAVLAALGLPANGTVPGIAAGTNVFFGTTGPNQPGSLDPAPGNRNANNNGNLPASAYTYSTGRLSSYNFNESAGSLPDTTRKGLFAAWERKLAFAENLRFYGDAFYQDVFAVDELAPFATGNFETPGQTTIVIPARTANPILTPGEIAAGGVRTAAAGAYNPFNPFNQDIAGSSRIRLAEFGNRIFKNHNTAFAVTGGLRTEGIAGKWNLDASVRYSSITNNLNAKLISTSRFLRAMNAADPIFNPSSPSYIGTTQPYNPFGYYRNPIASNTAPVDFATHYQRDENVSRLLDAGATLNTASLVEIAGGDVGFAIGTEFYREAITQLPDSALQAGDILGTSPSSPIARQRKIGSLFTEAEIPLVSEKNSLSGIRRLSLNVAARYERFFTSDRSTFVPKVGVRWEPTDGSLVFRASYGEGFMEPSLYQLYSPPVAALTPINDPLTGNQEPEQNITTAGNPALSPEDSQSINVGLVWSPKGALDGFTWSMDYWQIEQTGQVSANPQDVVDRAVAGQALLPGEAVIRDFAGNIVLVRSVFRNLGVTKVRGMDFSASYLWKTSVGRWESGLTASYMDSYKNSTDAALPLVELIDTEVPGTAGDDAYLKWKGIAFLSWAQGGLSSRLQAVYTHGFQDFDGNGDPFRVKATTTFDLQASYQLSPTKGGEKARWYSDTKVTLGCNNLLDKDPPFASSFANNSNGYPGFIYNATGRFVYLSLEKKL